MEEVLNEWMNKCWWLRPAAMTWPRRRSSALSEWMSAGDNCDNCRCLTPSRVYQRWEWVRLGHWELGPGAGQRKCVGAESWNDDKKKLFRRQCVPPSHEPHLFNNFLQFYCLHLCSNSHMSSVFGGGVVWCAAGVCLSSSSLAKSFSWPGLSLFPTLNSGFCQLMFASTFFFAAPRFFRAQFACEFAAVCVRPSAMPVPDPCPDSCPAAPFLPFPARLQDAPCHLATPLWPPADSSCHLFARFFAPRSLFIFYAPLTTFARFTFPVSGGGSSDVFESLIVVACLFASPATLAGRLLLPPPLLCFLSSHDPVSWSGSSRSRSHSCPCSLRRWVV